MKDNVLFPIKREFYLLGYTNDHEYQGLELSWHSVPYACSVVES